MNKLGKIFPNLVSSPYGMEREEEEEGCLGAMEGERGCSCSLLNRTPRSVLIRPNWRALSAQYHWSLWNEKHNPCAPCV
eukprot:6690854-Ditylum_brightwellii.AAC.1